MTAARDSTVHVGVLQNFWHKGPNDNTVKPVKNIRLFAHSDTVCQGMNSGNVLHCRITAH